MLANAQLNWMLGTWNSNNNITINKSRLLKTIVIDSVSGENFAGTKTSELDDRSHARIVASISGSLNKEQLFMQTGAVLYKKEPSNGQWWDCSSCTPENKIAIKDNKLVLSVRITGCQQNCDGVSVYYRDLCDYDSATQHYLVNLFGTSSDIASFKPCVKKPPEIIVSTSDPDQIKPDKNAEKNISKIERKRQQQINDSLQNIAAALRKRQQAIGDSLKTVADNAGKLRQQQIDDSTKNAIALAKKRQQQIDDSISIAKKRKQQTDDSLQMVAAIAKKRQQQIKDSLQNVAAIAKQKEQQHIQDSLNNVAIAAKKRQQEVDDSTKNAIALAKIHQQHIDDSISTAKKRQQQIDDSLEVVAAIAKKRQQAIEDSLKTVADIEKKKRQQQIDDSLQMVATIAKKRQQQIDDSTKNAIALEKKRQQQINDSIIIAKKRKQQMDDSLQNVVAIAKQKQQQRIQDSVNNAAIVAKRRQKQIDDSTSNALAIAKLRQQQIDDSISVAKKRQQQINDSTTLAKQKEQMRIQDSITNSLAKANRKTNGKDTIKSSTVKAFETRKDVLLQTYHITTPDILVEIFDNAEIDGDRVSVYHNNTLIVNNQMLTHDAITFKIHADATSRVHEFVMIAENLGTIPPNTALMRITVGTQVYKLGVKTDLQTNAKIVFYYDGN